VGTHTSWPNDVHGADKLDTDLYTLLRTVVAAEPVAAAGDSWEENNHLTEVLEEVG